MVSQSPSYPFLRYCFKVSIINSESCFCIFMCVVLTCLLIFFFFYFLMKLMVLEEYRLAVSFSFFEAVVYSFSRLCFYQLRFYFNLFLHVLYIIFQTSFLGSINITLEEHLFTIILSFSILSNKFTVLFLERCLFAF